MSSSPVTNKTVNERYSKLSETLKKLTVDSPDVDGTENLKDTEKKKQLGTDENLDIQMHLSRTEIPKSNGVISLDEEVESESESEEEDSSDEDDDPITAPLELMGEFLQYIRQGKWEDAKKLCVMILIYEPSNVEALQFQPVIDAKIQIEQELAEMSGSSSSEEEEDSDESSDEEESEDGDDTQEEDDDDYEDIDRRDHLPNKLIFETDKQEVGIWKP